MKKQIFCSAKTLYIKSKLKKRHKYDTVRPATKKSHFLESIQQKQCT